MIPDKQLAKCVEQLRSPEKREGQAVAEIALNITSLVDDTRSREIRTLLDDANELALDEERIVNIQEQEEIVAKKVAAIVEAYLASTPGERLKDELR